VVPYSEFSGPPALNMDASGKVLFAFGTWSSSMPAQVLRVNPDTGSYQTLTAGGDVVWPNAMAVEANGNILISNFGFMVQPTVVRVDRMTGAQTVLGDTGAFWNLGMGVVIHPDFVDLTVARPTMPRRATLSLEGANGQYMPTAANITDGVDGYVAILNMGNAVSDDKVLALLDLKLTGSTTAAQVMSDLLAAGFNVTNSDPDGLLARYGYDLLLSFDNPRTGGPLYFAWDFSRYSDVSLSGVAVVPEPASVFLLSLAGIGLLVRRRRAA
jgi:hypothetical protein